MIKKRHLELWKEKVHVFSLERNQVPALAATAVRPLLPAMGGGLVPVNHCHFSQAASPFLPAQAIMSLHNGWWALFWGEQSALNVHDLLIFGPRGFPARQHPSACATVGRHHPFLRRHNLVARL